MPEQKSHPVQSTDSALLLIFRYFRFLLRSAEEAISKAPSLEQLQNQATTTKAELQAIRNELAATTQKQNLESATSAEEKDGRLNET